MADHGDGKVRLDRWLWAARFFKTRRLAVDAIQGGKVAVNGGSAKPGRSVKAGDRLEVTKGTQRFEVVVEGVAEQRGPAREAEALYHETEESIQAREKERENRRKTGGKAPHPGERPDRRSRRRLSELKRGGG